MLDRLNTNAYKCDPNVSSTDTIKKAIQSEVKNREYFLELAGGLDATMEIPAGGIRDHHQGHLLSKVIALFVTVKTRKSKIFWPQS